MSDDDVRREIVAKPDGAHAAVRNCRYNRDGHSDADSETNRASPGVTSQQSDRERPDRTVDRPGQDRAAESEPPEHIERPAREGRRRRQEERREYLGEHETYEIQLLRPDRGDSGGDDARPCRRQFLGGQSDKDDRCRRHQDVQDEQGAREMVPRDRHRRGNQDRIPNRKHRRPETQAQSRRLVDVERCIRRGRRKPDDKAHHDSQYERDRDDRQEPRARPRCCAHVRDYIFRYTVTRRAAR